MKTAATIILFAGLLLGARVRAGEVNNGGNVLPDDQLSVSQIVDVLSEARREVYAYLKSEDLARNPKFARLLSASPSIFETLLKVKIDIRLDRPCLDEAGKDADGSSVSESKDAICISVPRLQTKVTEENYRYKILALVVHEFSHRAGFSEPEAVDIQKLVQAALRREAHPAKDRFSANVVRLQTVKKWIAEFDQHLEHFLDIRGYAETIERGLGGIAKLHLVGREDYNMLMAFATVADGIHKGICALQKCAPDWENAYNAVFGRHLKISAWQYLPACSLPDCNSTSNKFLDPSILGSVVLTRMQPSTYKLEAAKQIQAMVPYVDKLLVNAIQLENLKD